jgi:tetratricopeptide (TPR) repeat protein
MLTGRHLFQVKKLAAWKQAHINEKPVFEKPFKQQVPKRLQKLVMRCLEKKPEDRPQTWGDVVEELAALYEEITGRNATLEITGPELVLSELIDKGNSLIQLGRFDEAIAAFDRALELQPESSRVWARRGLALRRQARYAEALVCYDKSLELSPQYAIAWSGKGIVLERLGLNRRWPVMRPPRS